MYLHILYFNKLKALSSISISVNSLRDYSDNYTVSKIFFYFSIKIITIPIYKTNGKLLKYLPLIIL